MGWCLLGFGGGWWADWLERDFWPLGSRLTPPNVRTRGCDTGIAHMCVPRVPLQAEVAMSSSSSVPDSSLWHAGCTLETAMERTPPLGIYRAKRADVEARSGHAVQMAGGRWFANSIGRHGWLAR